MEPLIGKPYHANCALRQNERDAESADAVLAEEAATLAENLTWDPTQLDHILKLYG